MIHAFYAALEAGRPVPVSARGGRAGGRSAALDLAERRRRARCAWRMIPGLMMRALVTGATGFVGNYLTRALLGRGHSVRVLTRTRARAAPLERRVRRCGSPMWDRPCSLAGVASGASTWSFTWYARRPPLGGDFERIDVRGTGAFAARSRAGRRTAIRVREHAGRLSPPDRGSAAVFDEQTPFDRTRLARQLRASQGPGRGPGHRRRIDASSMETLILRLGLVCGVGAAVLPAHVCQPLKRDWVILFGDGSVPLPLTYIDNAVDALILAATARGSRASLSISWMRTS